MLPLQEDTGALISAAAAAAAQQQQEQAAGQQPQQQQQPELPHMGAAFQRTAAAWQEDQDSEETEGGLPEGVVLVRLLPVLCACTHAARGYLHVWAAVQMRLLVALLHLNRQC